MKHGYGLDLKYGLYNDSRNVYAYDALQRMTSVEQTALGPGDVLHKKGTFAYDPLGQFDLIERYVDTGSGLTKVLSTDYGYDAHGRVESIEHTNVPDSQVLAEYVYGYDAQGRIATFTHTGSAGNDGTTTYSYDGIGQVIGADRPSTALDETFRWDLAGNPVNAIFSTDGWQTGAANRLLESEKSTFAYDEEGNRTLEEDRSTGDYQLYTWDDRGRLTQVDAVSFGAGDQ